MKLSSDARYCALRVELAPLNLVQLRARVHVRLPLLADRQAFDAATIDARHEALVEAGARAVVRAELVASFRPVPATAQLELPLVEGEAGDRVSAVELRPGLARVVPIDARRRRQGGARS